MATGTSWTAIKKALVQLNQDEILSLLKDLHDASASNKAFLRARFLAAEISLEDYEKRIHIAFYSRSKHGPSDGYPKLSEGKAVLREFKKARPDDLRSYLDLQLYYVEVGTSFTNEFGDMYEAFYNSLLSVTKELLQRLERPEHQTLFTYFLPRLKQLYSDGDGFGWGFTDELHSSLEGLAEAQGQSDVFPKRRIY